MKTSNRKKGVIFSYILMILEVLSTIFVTPFILSSLGKGDFGVYKLVTSIIAYLMLLDLGVGNAAIRYISKYRLDNDIDSNRKFMGVITIFYISIAAISLVAGFVLTLVFPYAFAKGLTAEEIVLAQQLLMITTITTAVTLGTTGFMNAIVAYEQFGVAKIPNIIQILVRTVLIIIALKANYGAVALVVINLITTLLCRTFYVIYSCVAMKCYPVFKGLKHNFIKEILIYTSFIMLQMIATQLNQSVDQILIGSVVANSSSYLGIYGVAAQLNQYFMSIGTAITGVLMPGVVKLVKENNNEESIRHEMSRIGRIVFFPLLAIYLGFVLYGQEFLLLWAGEGYQDAYGLSLTLMGPQLFILTQSIGNQILWAENKHKEISIIKLSIVVSNIGLTLLLININPIYGAATGTLISLLLGDIVASIIVFKKKLSINLLKYFGELYKGFIWILIIVPIICLGFKQQLFFDNQILSFVVNLLLYVLLFVVVLYNVLNKEEKAQINKIFRRNKAV